MRLDQLHEAWDKSRVAKLAKLRKAIKGRNANVWFNPDTGKAIIGSSDPSTTEIVKKIVGADNISDGHQPGDKGWVEI